ncbi:hypothetical protein NKR19_g7364 [Coniochaeta hoffmannii]|uniref:Uncharacterized protein n=1 Tax=Coniochaeta hoffmannii TaxID=91930 RepID=A0AA38R876_9PEZI|nr:hypothetical protein NKR19_g7364 [Coniochaeta hoffmannii]
MMRNTLSILQKTYDECYMRCSTAVYYESQGNEPEAMRCWKAALEQIYDHNANKIPRDHVARTQTERALVESLRQLELQCKERIDLLEALRISRQEDVVQRGSSLSGGNPTISADSSDQDRGKGYIGGAPIAEATAATFDGTATRATSQAVPVSQSRAPGASHHEDNASWP